LSVLALLALAAASPAPAAVNDPALRPALEAAYEADRRALLARDADAVIALRTPDFSAITPDGTVHDSAEMAGATRNMLANVRKWELLSFEIGPVTRSGDEVSADIGQHSIRLQLRSDGQVHRIENWVTQRETWVVTPAGLRIRRVDNLRDQKVLIDGQPR
jgi:hypothetical protein